MKVTIGTKTFIVRFNYPEIQRVIHKSEGFGVSVRQRESVCKILYCVDESQLDCVCEAAVRNDSREQFIKVIGRDLAFKKALHNLFSSKELREMYGLSSSDFNAFMNSYHACCTNSLKR